MSIKQDKKKAALSRGGTEWKIPPSVAKQTAWGPEDAWTNLALFRRITALSEEFLGFGETEGVAKSTSRHKNNGIPLRERMRRFEKGEDLLGCQQGV